jgi:L-aspartate oxidase
LSLALTLPDHLRIAVLSKGDLANGSTFWAQGGVAAVLDDTDTVESHVDDTLNAGGGLCHEDAVRFTVEHSKEAIQWLIDQGVPFTRDEQSGTEDGGFEFHLTREGGHSHRPPMPPAPRFSGPCSTRPGSDRTSSCWNSGSRST